jgi:hypothetical protein
VGQAILSPAVCPNARNRAADEIAHSTAADMFLLTTPRKSLLTEPRPEEAVFVKYEARAPAAPSISTPPEHSADLEIDLCTGQPHPEAPFAETPSGKDDITEVPL